MAFVQPLPIPDEDSAPYWDGCRVGELRLQRCTDCGAYRFPAQRLCPTCLSDASEWCLAEGTATVYSFAVVRRALGPNWSDRVPYVVALVDLSEGPRMFTNIVDCAPENVAIGMPLAVVFDPVSDTVTLPKFRPA